MATERMRLEAEMRDSASPVIAKLRKELTDLQNDSREGRAITKLNSELALLRKEAGGVRVLPGMNAVGGWFRKTGIEASDFTKAASGASTAFSTLGIGGLAATASIGGLAAAMREMGNRTLAMRELGREIGVSTDYLNAFSHAGQHFGVSSEVMQGALNHLSGQMPEFKRNYGALFQELSRRPDLIKNLQGEGAEGQVKDIVKFLGQAKLQNEPQLQKQLAEAIFGSGADIEKLFSHGAQGLLNEIQRQQSQLGAISPEMLKAAQDYRDAQIGFTDSLEKFETTVGPRFLGLMTGIVNKATEFFDPDRSKYEKKQREGGARDERGHDGGTDWMDDARVRDALRKKSGFSGDAGSLFHLSGYGGGAQLSGGADVIAAGTRAGFLAALREYASTGDAAEGGARSGGGIINASLGGGGGGGFGAGTGGRGFGGGGGLPGGEAGPLVDTGSDGVIGGPGFNTRGVRNKNIGNIGYGAWAKAHGAIGSSGTDTGHGVAVFPSFAAGAAAASALALKKYSGGKKTIDALIAGQHGWTPGNHAAAANIARSMGLSPFADAHLDSSDMMDKFKHGLAAQELGPNGAKYAFQKMGAGAVGGGVGAGGGPVDIARALRGAGESQAGQALGHYMHSGQWCADFVNGALAKAGGRGTGNAMARSFFGWGHHVGAGGAAKGDVLVKGSHVGFATGAPVMHNGQMMIPMISGNHGHRVGEGWARMNEYEVRRAEGLDARTAGGAARPAPGSQHQLDIRLHDRGGAVQSTSMKSSGHGLHPRLQRWPTAPGMVDA